MARARIKPLDPAAHALALHRYAGTRLEPPSLHAWMVQRLMLDTGLDHSCSCQVTDEGLERSGRQLHGSGNVLVPSSPRHATRDLIDAAAPHGRHEQTDTTSLAA